jgi:hypothetical protein
MNTIIALIIFILGITVSIWNAYVILWGVHKNLPNWNTVRLRFSKIWHGVGLFLRFEFAILIAWLLVYHPGAWFDWFLFANWGLTFFIVMGFAYDFIINLIRNIEANYPAIWYVDDKGVNAWFLKVFKTEASVWWFRGLLILVNIVSWIIYLK